MYCLNLLNLGKILLFICLLAISTSAWAETKLSYPQRQVVDRQSATMREVDKKIKDGFAPNEAAGLKQKLDNILADLTKNNCPDDNEQVKALKESVANARKALGENVTVDEKKVEENKPEIKKGEVKDDKVKNLPEKEQPGKAVPENKNTDAKLSYPHKQAVDRQTSNLNQVEAGVKEMVEKEPEIKYYPKKIEPGLGYKVKLEGIIGDLERSGCPKDHKIVADMYSRVEAAKKTIVELEKKLQPKWELYEKYSNIVNYPTYQSDLEHLKRLGDKYGNSATNFGNAKQAKELISTYPDEAKYFNTLGKLYAPIINFKTSEGILIFSKLKFIAEKMKAFVEAKNAYGEKLPADIEKQLNDALAMGKKAVEDKKPMFFQGGVRQLTDGALEDVEMLETIKGKEDSGAIKGRGSYTKIKSELDKMALTMEEEIVASTEAPKDIYSGGDKNKLKKMIEEKWQEKYPEDKILAIAFSVENWKRNTKWSYNNANEWYKTDTSYIPVKVVVKTNDSIASIFVAYANMDHMKNDEIRIGVDTKGGAYVVEKMLIKNLK